jgi:hypothetical protein
LRGGDGFSGSVQHDEPRAGGALIDCSDVVGHVASSVLAECVYTTKAFTSQQGAASN